MTRKLPLAALAILLVATPRAGAGQATPTSPPAPVAALGVDLLMKEPEKHPGTLVVGGVVKTASKKSQRLRRLPGS